MGILIILFENIVKNMPKRKQKSSLHHPSIHHFILLLTFAASVMAESQASICQNILSNIRQLNDSEIQRHIEQLQQNRQYPCVLELYPRYFWAQNMSHILVKFQFLNSADTSACERVLSVKKTVQHNKFSLSLICLQSNLLIRYRIAVTTLMPLNFYHAVWKEANQNTIILECLKSPSPYFWKKLYLAQQQPVRKPKVWWKMVDKYMEDTKKFIYDLEIQEEEFDVSNYVKKKKKAKKSKQSIQLQPFSKKYFYCNQNNPFELGSWIV